MSAWSPNGQRCKHRRRGLWSYSLTRLGKVHTSCTRCGKRLDGTYELTPLGTDEDGLYRAGVGAVHWRADQ